MSDPAVHELAHPPPSPKGPSHGAHGARGSRALRIGVALAVIAVVVWYLRSRHEERAAPTKGGTAGETAGRPAGRGGGEGSGEGRVVPVQVAQVERKDLPI